MSKAFRVCPRCGFEHPPEPYEYSGYLKPYLPFILKSFRMKVDIHDIAETVNEIMPDERTKNYWWQPHHTTAAIAYIGRRYGLYQGNKNDPVYDNARREHAWLLRAEGARYRRIAERLDVSVGRARQMVLKFGRDFSRAIKRTRWEITC